MKTRTYNLTNEGVTLTSYLLDYSKELKGSEKRPFMLLFPGGAYKICSDREAEPIAMHFLSMGIDVFILRYSLNENSIFPRPLDDAKEAFSFILSNADDFGIDTSRSAVCGFSAGGHLAAAFALMGGFKISAMVLGYPCITEDICNSTVLYSSVPALDSLVNEKTPPTFIFAASDDKTVPLRSSLELSAALSKSKVPYELHIYENGGHGFATADYVTCDGVLSSDAENWVAQCKSFLKKRFFA